MKAHPDENKPKASPSAQENLIKLQEVLEKMNLSDKSNPLNMILRKVKAIIDEAFEPVYKLHAIKLDHFERYEQKIKAIFPYEKFLAMQQPAASKPKNLNEVMNFLKTEPKDDKACKQYIEIAMEHRADLKKKDLPHLKLAAKNNIELAKAVFSLAGLIINLSKEDLVEIYTHHKNDSKLDECLKVSLIKLSGLPSKQIANVQSISEMEARILKTDLINTIGILLTLKKQQHQREHYRHFQHGESAEPVREKVEPGLQSDIRQLFENNQNPYAVLNLDELKNPKPEEIKQHYKTLVVERHPDKHGNSEDAIKKFEILQYSYNVLSNEAAKQLWSDINALVEAKKTPEEVLQVRDNPKLMQCAKHVSRYGTDFDFIFKNAKEAKLASDAPKVFDKKV